MKSGEKRLFLIVLVIALALTTVALFPVWQQQREAARLAVQQVHTPRELILGDSRHSRGPSNAPFVLVEFADYTCAHCAGAAPYVDGLVRQRPRDLRHVFRCLPIERHPTAVACDRAAEAAALQGRFWEMQSGLFARKGEKTSEEIEAIARTAGLDMARYHKDVASDRVASLAATDSGAADALEIPSTPTFFFITPRHTYRIKGGDYLKSFLDDPSHWQ